MIHRGLFFLLVLLLQGCADMAYLGQAVNGHLWVLQERRPLNEVIADESVPEAQRQMLRKALRIRQFASETLGLPDNDSYRTYSDLGRNYVVINVVATQLLSLQAKHWCYPITGCLPYRGYYSLDTARALSAQLQAQGWETWLGRVPAYSTLGWFDDPLLNTMLEWGEADLAGMVFHELLHQKLYVSDDTVFNESLAVVLEREGVRRWLQQEGDTAELARWQQQRKKRARVQGLLRRTRGDLQALYEGPGSDLDKRVAKVALLDQTRARYRAMRREQGWGGGYDDWFGPSLNNAFLALMNTYHQYVPAFEVVLSQANGDLAVFYQRVEALARLDKDQRKTFLEEICVNRCESNHSESVEPEV